MGENSLSALTLLSVGPSPPSPRLAPPRAAGVDISEGALVAAATLAARYISGRFLPDKAIDLMDEATAQVGGCNHAGAVV